MTPLQAEKIINHYWESIKDLRPKAIVQPIKDLPYSVGLIRYAHFLYAEYLVKENILTKEVGDRLISSYSDIDRHFVEDPDSINAKYRKHMEGLEKGIISDFRFSEVMGSVEMAMEFNNFLAECQSSKERN